MVIFGGVVGILQAEKLVGGVDLGVFPGHNGLNGAGIARHLQGLVDVKGALLTVDGNLAVNQRAVIGDENGGGVVGNAVNGALPFLAVAVCHGDGFPGGKAGVIQVYGQIAVHGQQGQGPFFVHDGGHIIALFGIDGLHPAGNTCVDGGADLVVAGAVNIGVQIVQFFLHGGQGGQHGAFVDAGQKRARFHLIALLHKDLFHLDGRGDGKVFHILADQSAGAGYRGLNGAYGYGSGFDI